MSEGQEGQERQAYSLGELPVVVALRTGLVVDDEGIYRQLPSDMYGVTVEQVVNYALREEHLNAAERPFAESIRSALSPGKNRRTTYTVNGRTGVGGSDGIANHLIVSNSPSPQPDGTMQFRQYRLADIRVATAQEGGLEVYLR